MPQPAFAVGEAPARNLLITPDGRYVAWRSIVLGDVLIVRALDEPTTRMISAIRVFPV